MRVFILFLGLILFFQISFANDFSLIDPKLIKITKTKEVNKRKFHSKNIKDNTIYKKNNAILSKEEANLYQILDKILRANKIYNQNYRIGFKIETQEINAISDNSNLILLNSALYDSFLEDDSALAFIIAHEISHLLLNHGQICAQNNLKIQQIKKQIQELDLLDKNYEKNLLKLKKKLNEIYKNERNLELSADIEALALISRANYNSNGAIEVIKFLSKLENIYTKRSLHPNCKNRLKALENELELIDIAELKTQGRNNLFYSEPLKVKKSIDNKTIILIKPKNIANTDYIAIQNYEKLNKKAYQYFLNNDLTNAKIYFEKAYKEKKNYTSALYLKNIFEFEYNKTNDKKLLKIISLWQKRANKLKPLRLNT